MRDEKRTSRLELRIAPGDRDVFDLAAKSEGMDSTSAWALRTLRLAALRLGHGKRAVRASARAKR